MVADNVLIRLRMVSLWLGFILGVFLLSGPVQAAVKIVSVMPSAILLQAGKSTTLTIKGAGLKSIRSGGVFRDKAGKQKVARLNVRYTGGINSGKLTLTLAGRVKPGIYYIHIADGKKVPAVLPVKATVRVATVVAKLTMKNSKQTAPAAHPTQSAQLRSKNTQGNTTKSHRPTLKKQQSNASQKATLATRQKAIEAKRRAALTKSNSTILAKSNTTKTNKVSSVRKNEYDRNTSNTRDDRNREQEQVLTGNNPEQHNQPAPTGTKQQVAGLLSPNRKDPNQTDSMGAAQRIVSGMASREEAVTGRVNDQNNNDNAVDTAQLPSNSPFSQTESNSSGANTNSAQDIMEDVKEGGAPYSMGLAGAASMADANQSGSSAANNASIRDDMTVDTAKKVGTALDATSGVLVAGAGYLAATGTAAAATAAAPVIAGGVAVIAGAKLLDTGIDVGLKSYQDAKDDKVLRKMDEEGKVTIQAAQDRGDKKRQAKSDQKAAEDNQRTGGQSTEGADGGGQSTENANGESNESNTTSANGQCTIGADGNGQCTEQGMEKTDGPSGNYLSARESAQIRALQPKTTKVGNQINVGRDGVEFIEGVASSPLEQFGDNAGLSTPGSAENVAGQMVAGSGAKPPPRATVRFQDEPLQSQGPRNDRDMNIGTAPINDNVTHPASSSTQRSSGRKQTTQAKSIGVQEAANRLGTSQLAIQVGRRDYVSLISPSNACTALVRRVCGDIDQCSRRAGCPVAKQLLDRFNQNEHSADVGASCNASLEDGIIFPECS